MSEGSEIKVNATLVGDTLTVLQGKAADPINKNPYSIKGGIEAPADFYDRRKEQVKPENSFLRVDRPNRKVELQVDPDYSGHSKVTVTGSLLINPVLEEMGINYGESSSKEFDKDALMKLFRFNRNRFADPQQSMKVVAKLQDFQMKLDARLEDKDNQRGNRRMLVEHTVEDVDLPETIDLEMEVFQGQGKVTFAVELLFAVQGASGISFRLESPQLAEMIDSVVEEIMDKQRRPFDEAGIPVVEA